MDSHLVSYCAPTLQGLKPASLFSLPQSIVFAAEEKTHALNKTLTDRGLRLCLIPRQRAPLVFVFRPALLEQCLHSPRPRAFLQGCGYDTASPSAMLNELFFRLEHGSLFPHEVGLFLGYPIEDVEGFIRHRGKHYLFSGYWKVYFDPDARAQLFERYDSVHRELLRLYRAGAPIEMLTKAP